MARRQPQSQPTWTDVKAKLAGFDRLGLLGLIQDLYAIHKDNRTFLHARFGLGQDVLALYKEALDRWLWPDVLRDQDTSVVRAKQAISSYRKAVGDPAGLAELMVFYCERAAGFCSDIGYQDDGYFNALVSMFGQALKAIARLSASDRNALIARLDRVRVISHNSATVSATIWIPCSRNTSESDPDSSRHVAQPLLYAGLPKAHCSLRRQYLSTFRAFSSTLT
jgi:hypothetical protein